MILVQRPSVGADVASNSRSGRSGREELLFDVAEGRPGRVAAPRLEAR